MSQAPDRPSHAEETLSDTLCQECERLCETGFRPYKFLLKNDYEAFLRSARRCAFCSIMLTSLRRAYRQFDDDYNRLNGFSEQHVGYDATGATDISSAKRKRTLFELSAVGLPPHNLRVTASMNVKREKIETTSKIMVFSGHDPDPRLDEEAKYKLIRQWFSEEEVSSTTSSLTTNSTMPKRLISIGEQPTLVNTLRLIETRDLTQHILAKLEYVTLSHRWGASRHFVTEMITLEDRCAGFHIEALPLTYQDAVVIAQKLGFQYLWIDAVCIVQDDDEEWEQEAVRMGGIYNSAAITIAAHCSANDDDGFLVTALQKPPATRIPYDSAGMTGKEWNIYGSQLPNFDADVSGSNLCGRAWVLQERLLSPRILHFTDGFIYWESLRHTKAEDGMVSVTEPAETTPDSIDGEVIDLQLEIDKLAVGDSRKDDSDIVDPTSETSELADAAALGDATSRSWIGNSRFCLSDMPELSRVLYRTIQGPQQSSVFDRMIVPFDYPRSGGLEGEISKAQQSSPFDWFRVVEFYSTTSITHSKDRLIAISGLARHIHRRIGVPYYCGLWADRFLIQLLWFRGGPYLGWPVEPRAPSWSWAAVDGEILYPMNVSKVSVESGIRVLGLAAEPMVRGVALGRTSWLGGLGSPILHVKMRKVSSSGFSILGDEDLGYGPKKARQMFSLLDFRRSILSMRLRYQSRTVGLIVWDDTTFDGDKSPAELKAMVPTMFCVRIAHIKPASPPPATVNISPSCSTATLRVGRFAQMKRDKLRQREDSDSDQSSPERPQMFVRPRRRTRAVPSKESWKKAHNEHSPTPGADKGRSNKRPHLEPDGPIFLVLFLIAIDKSETIFRRIACGQVSPEFAGQSEMWISKTIAII